MLFLIVFLSLPVYHTHKASKLPRQKQPHCAAAKQGPTAPRNTKARRSASVADGAPALLLQLQADGLDALAVDVAIALTDARSAGQLEAHCILATQPTHVHVDACCFQATRPATHRLPRFPAIKIIPIMVSVRGMVSY